MRVSVNPSPLLGLYGNRLAYLAYLVYAGSAWQAGDFAEHERLTSIVCRAEPDGSVTITQ